jgi:hypothetical protein
MDQQPIPNAEKYYRNISNTFISTSKKVKQLEEENIISLALPCSNAYLH